MSSRAIVERGRRRLTVAVAASPAIAYREDLVAKPLASAVCLCVFHPLVRQELTRVVSSEAFRPVSCRTDPDMLESRGLLRIPRASVYIVDSPSRRERAEFLISEILARFPRARILVVTEKLDEDRSFAFLRWGARGLLRYSEIEGRLGETLRTLCSGGYWVPRGVLCRFIEKAVHRQGRPAVRPPNAALSTREKEVLTLLCDNLSNKEIASRIHVSSRTVKFHVSNLLAKYGVKGRADLLRMQMD